MNNSENVLHNHNKLNINKPQIFTFLFLSLGLIGFLISLLTNQTISYMFLLVVPFSWMICLSAFGSTISYKRAKDSKNAKFWFFVLIFAFLNIFITSLAIGLISVEKQTMGYLLFIISNLIIISLTISSLFIKNEPTENNQF
ncbi:MULTISPECIES: hypothetical protein [unclassified Mycoplasma]|uniref:hypothetical protein n=1 Tax=unclassified Mycoplasma TaxID=2683645 RepID=UPI00211CEF1D|nr:MULTISPECIES: hypothetical protein [unclassified Mycoplasma]UUM19785.1 hypothetical protein NPA11_03390 [Mycoplasma sp. 1578d]UUM24768.1 hypothetical protein NPA12_03680 [Mycoplasma sp. 3686d]